MLQGRLVVFVLCFCLGAFVKICFDLVMKKYLDQRKFVKRVAIWVAVVAALIVAVIGICFGKVIEGSLAAEVGKWVLMGLLVIGILEGFVYFLGPLIWHFTYGKRK